MHEHDSVASVEQRLSQQLHGLIDLTAELTKRLLATEERLLALETAPDSRPGDQHDEVRQLLEEGQQQVRHLHLLLNPEAESAVAEVAEQPEDEPHGMEEHPETEHAAFLDEPQQHHDDDEHFSENDDQMPLLSA